MTPAGAKLDAFLARSIGQFRTTDTAQMPEVGGRKLAGEFGDMLAGVRKMVDETKLGIASAVTALTTELQGGKEIERQLLAEAAEVRKAFGEVLGNRPPPDEKPAGGANV